jgi:hypothetical protein
MKKQSLPKKEGISDDIVKQATGKRWEEWYAILDEVRATKLPHTEIARYLYIHHLENNGWWCQMIANRYEEIKGIKKKRQNQEVFQVSVSIIIAVPITYVYEAWIVESIRKKWLRELGFEITNIIPNTLISMDWNDKKTSVDVYFNEQGPKESQVIVEHRKLMNKILMDKKTKYWTTKLDKLSKHLLSHSSP